MSREIVGRHFYVNDGSVVLLVTTMALSTTCWVRTMEYWEGLGEFCIDVAIYELYIDTMSGD